MESDRQELEVSLWLGAKVVEEAWANLPGYYTIALVSPPHPVQTSFFYPFYSPFNRVNVKNKN
jgi:hypothetical protein